MRRLNEDSGVVAPLIAVMLLALIGLAAIVVDVGAVYAERRQLQNGADAGALAIAQQCAAGSCSGYQAIADEMANLNSHDGTSTATVAIPGELGGGSFTVTTTTREPSGSAAVSHWLAPLIGVNSTAVAAKATASMGAVGGGATIPLAMSFCTWQTMTGGNISNLPTAISTVYHHGSSQHTGSTCGTPSGGTAEGGFAWLDLDGTGTCTANVQLNNVGGDTGSGSPTPAASTGCTDAFFQGLLGRTVLMPIFGSYTGTGSNVMYFIEGFAALEVTGYRFGGSTASIPAPCGNPERCISGRFVEYYAVGAQPTTSVPSFGAYSVGLTG